VKKDAEEIKAENIKELDKKIQDYKTIKPRLETAFKKAGEDPGYDIEKEVLSIYGNKPKNSIASELERYLRLELDLKKKEIKKINDVQKKTELESELINIKQYTPDGKDAKKKQEETVARKKDDIKKLDKNISDTNMEITDLNKKLSDAKKSKDEVFKKEDEKMVKLQNI
jgi:hypothetical protein